MAEIHDEKVELGKRLAAARDAAGLTQPTVAVMLTNAGYPMTKQAVSAQEVGRNVPDALLLKTLARLYDTTADALLGIEAHSAQAERLAVIFDSLEPVDQALLLRVCEPFAQAYAASDNIFADATVRVTDSGHRRISPAARPRRAVRTAPSGRRKDD